MESPEPLDAATARLTPTRSLTKDLARKFPETLGYRLKNIFFGPPLITEQLESERLSKPVALGVLAPDCISSSAYGAEQMLTQLTPFVGLAAFTLVVPVTMAIIGVLFFVTLSYFDVIGTYTKFGGSYVVARDNFGYKIAQIAAVALLIDYTVTVAVQSSAGTAALTSALPSLAPFTVEITVTVVLLLIYGNLRGIKEAGKIFAFPTYFYILTLAIVILLGVYKEFSGTLHVLPIPDPSVLVGGRFGSEGTGWLMGLAYIQLLRCFANGGSSLTGLEAISDGVASFRKPETTQARQTLILMSCVLAFLVLGTSLLASWTHAVPYAAGTPTVVSQEIKAVLGSGPFGQIFFYVAQLATLLILYAGGNTSFNGFPFLANFVAGDQFLPRQMRKRGHRLAFSNAVMVLGVVAIALVLAFDAKVTGLVSLYAIGVFTGFTMAGFGMVKHHLNRKENPRWRRGVVINGVSGGISMVVVVIFMLAKFQEGAWIVVVIGPLLYLALIRLHRQYEEEDNALRSQGPEGFMVRPRRRHVAIVLVDSFDLATARALSYARTLSQNARAVHFDIDPKVTRDLQDRWAEFGPKWLPLDIIECPDRRLERASIELVADAVSDGDTECTVLLPRRSFASRLSRILHDRTADSIAAAVAVVPDVSATIIPYNLADFELTTSLEAEEEEGRAWGSTPEMDVLPADERLRERAGGSMAIADAQWRSRAKVAGRIKSVRVQTGEGASNLECTISDGTGSLMLVFQGRPTIPGIEPGARLVVEGMVGSWHQGLAILNPDYELVAGATHHDGEHT
ncbi:MAG: amino acid permease [Actinomycetes bacterium]